MIDDPDLPAVGVIPIVGGHAVWRVWAPKAKAVELVLGEGQAERTFAMKPEDRGYHSVVESSAGDGERYRYLLDGKGPFADPTSRWQPDGVGGPSAVFHPDQFTWDEGDWRGVAREALVIYELHVGTFTPEGTFDAAIPRIGSLLELGITAIELMPVAQFPGSRSWGYDGVFPFAVQNSYGGPEGLQRLVQACHRAGMAVFLDVVYNHFGPEGNVLPMFGDYLTERTKSDWGFALNFDDKGCDAVRAMVLDNVRMWVRDYRVDGLRLDAADQIFDRGPTPILREIADLAHWEASKLGRWAHVFAETDLNDAPRFLHQKKRGGYGLDGHWTDDFHHAAHSTLTDITSTSPPAPPRWPRRTMRCSSTTATTARSEVDGTALRPSNSAATASSRSSRTTIRSATGSSPTDTRRACPPGRSGSQAVSSCSPRGFRCCSWAKNMAKRTHSRSSRTSPAPTWWKRSAKAGRTSSPRSAGKGNRPTRSPPKRGGPPSCPGIGMNRGGRGFGGCIRI